MVAWKRVQSNKGTAGVDGISIDDFPAYLRQYWPEIKLKLLVGTYEPSPVMRVEIPKHSGGKRPLGIPTVLDRLIQQAILQVLQPIFDPGFSESSYGFRPYRSAHQAVRKVRQTIDEGYHLCLQISCWTILTKNLNNAVYVLSVMQMTL